MVLAGYQTAMRCLDTLLYDTPGHLLSFLLINIKKVELTLPIIPHTNNQYCMYVRVTEGLLATKCPSKDSKT